MAREGIIAGAGVGRQDMGFVDRGGMGLVWWGRAGVAVGLRLYPLNLIRIMPAKEVMVMSESFQIVFFQHVLLYTSNLQETQYAGRNSHFTGNH